MENQIQPTLSPETKGFLSFLNKTADLMVGIKQAHEDGRETQINDDAVLEELYVRYQLAEA